jgi:hypothetical protein
MANERRLFADLWRGAQRVLRADFQSDRATDEERSRLAGSSAPVTSRVAQDYAAWRHSVLWVAAISLLIHAVFELVGQNSIAEGLDAELVYALRPRNIALVDWLTRSVNIVLLLGSLLTLCAALAWRRVRASLWLARIAWLLMFATPFLLAALPLTRLMSLEHLPPQFQALLKSALGGSFALSIFFTIGPRAVALFPGIIRSSLAVKTLLPESPAPGWVILILGPLYSVFLLVLVTGMIQSQASFFLLAGAVCLMLSPLVFVLRRRDLVRPQSGAEAARMVSSTKRLAGVFSALGVVLLGIFLLRRPHVDVIDLFGFLTGVAGNVVLLMVVGADFIVGVLRSAHEIQKHFHGSALEAALEQKFDALAGLGVARAAPVQSEEGRSVEGVGRG